MCVYMYIYTCNRILEGNWGTKMSMKNPQTTPRYNFKGNEGTCGPTPVPLSKEGFFKHQREALWRRLVARSVWREGWPCYGHP